MIDWPIDSSAGFKTIHPVENHTFKLMLLFNVKTVFYNKWTSKKTASHSVHSITRVSNNTKAEAIY